MGPNHITRTEVPLPVLGYISSTSDSAFCHDLPREMRQKEALTRFYSGGLAASLGRRPFFFGSDKFSFAWGNTHGGTRTFCDLTGRSCAAAARGRRSSWRADVTAPFPLTFHQIVYTEEAKDWSNLVVWGLNSKKLRRTWLRCQSAFPLPPTKAGSLFLRSSYFLFSLCHDWEMFHPLYNWVDQKNPKDYLYREGNR